MLIMCFIHTFLFLNQKKSLYLIQFTQVVSFFKEDYLFMALHIFLSITAIQVNHSIQKRKILIKRRKVLGLNRLKKSLDLLHQRASFAEANTCVTNTEDKLFKNAPQSYLQWSGVSRKNSLRSLKHIYWSEKHVQQYTNIKRDAIIL